MGLDTIPKDRLEPGDILLCNIPDLSPMEYLKSVYDVVSTLVADKKFDLDAATPLIHWIIGYFDDYHYFHASFWNGEKLVESRMKGGLRANDISSYELDVVDVYRYSKDGKPLGDPSLPVDPLLRKAQALVDLHVGYGYDSAWLLAILCVTRWRREEWVDRIRDLMIDHLPPGVQDKVAWLFEEFRLQIDHAIEHLAALAFDVVRRYRGSKGWVCSETVAVIYNEAGDDTCAPGTYTIAKPLHRVDAPAPVLLASQDEGDAAAYEDVIERLRSQLAQLPSGAVTTALSAPSPSEYLECQAALRADTFYTPGDLARSSNTELAGRLKL